MTKPIDGGGPAFPEQGQCSGMSLRDWFGDLDATTPGQNAVIAYCVAGRAAFVVLYGMGF